MNSSTQLIPLDQLSLALIPVLLVLLILWRWNLQAGSALYALGRMLGQLLLIGYALVYLFDASTSAPVIGVLTIMLFASAWIALRTIHRLRLRLLPHALLAIFVGAGSTLVIVTQGVLMLSPWYNPQALIPLAGMVFAGSMNAVSLAADRLGAELSRQTPYPEARTTALQASLIPVINGLFAVGLVSLPGMMTGQILSGISPLIAVRYQILVMCMLFGAGGLSATLFLMLGKQRFQAHFKHSSSIQAA